ncbi:hypothetical protein LCGC14_1301200 [marine sediment metagenome]|uniref:Uncharacterized protein n=1 Tax=marine sediment metagenome TaxID=412755 RepID=A0A0F9KPV7_9ZZZZ
MIPPQTIDEIQRLMGELAAADYEHRKLPEFLELLEDGEEWVQNMRKFINGQ